MTLVPPSSEPTSQALVLTAPEPVATVEDDSAQSMLPAVPQGRQLELGKQAEGFVADLVKFNPNSPEFSAQVKDIQSLAQQEIVKSTAGPNRILERSSSSVAGSKRNGGDATQRVAVTLTELRGTVEDLTPNAAELTGVSKILGFIPGGKKIRHYFQKYQSAQTQLDGIVKALMAGQEELQKDNASLEQEKAQLWDVMGELNQYIILADSIDKELVKKISDLKAAGNQQMANALETDMLFAVRQRHQDLLTQLAVSVQGYMAMDLIRKNNVELIKGVDRARTTTLTALRVAVIVAQALDNQKLVLDQIDALNSTTNRTIAATGEMLKQQTARIQEQAVNSGVSVETLTKAFDDIYATMDAIDSFKVQANESMSKTIDGLTTQIERARPYLERTRALEGKPVAPEAPKQLGA